jgi:hypothetical protein
VTPSNDNDDDKAKQGMRVLVCGGRNFSDGDMLTAALNRLHQERGFSAAATTGASAPST